MITPLVEEYLSAHLQGHRTADDTRQILRLIDEAEHKDGTLVAEFDDVLHKISKNIPGLTLDFEKLVAGDPIECDPLVSQGNLAILRLDNLFHQAYAAWMKSGGSIQTIKRIMKAEDPATYSHRTEQQVRTDETYPPDAQILNQVVNITLSGFRIQATITHRRERLKSGDHDGVHGDGSGVGGWVPGDGRVPGDGLSQSNSASKKDPADNPPPENCHQATSLDDPDLIDENEIFKSNVGDLSSPIEGNTFAIIRGFNKFSDIKGYNELKPLVQNESVRPKAQNPLSDGVPCSDRCTQRSEHTEAASTVASDSRFESSNPRVPCSDCGTPRSEHAETTNNLSQNPREEDPVTLTQPNYSSSPTSHQPQTTGHSAPPFHKRE